MIKFINSIHDLRNFFSKIKDTDFKHTYRISFEKKQKVRSVSQNRLMWLYFACMEQETGQDKDDIHLYYKDKFLSNFIKLEVKEIFGKQLIKEPTTKDLNTLQFTQYLKKIEIDARVEFGINLPDPQDLQIESFIEHYSRYI